MPLSSVIVLSFLLFNFKTMVTWWYCPTTFNLFFHVSRLIFLLSRIWRLSSSQQYPIHHAGLHYLLSFYPLFLLSILVNPLLTSPVYFTQNLLIAFFPVHDFSKCVTGILSLVTGDDLICDSCLLDNHCNNQSPFVSHPWSHAILL